jgi:S1-C subfamily serine protease
LPFKGQKQPKSKMRITKGKKVSTGIIPDFAFSGKGVGVSGTVPNSPAKKSGIQKGDVIVAADNKPVKNLRDYSTVLKQFKPGDKLKLEVLRKGKIFKVELILAER